MVGIAVSLLGMVSAKPLAHRHDVADCLSSGVEVRQFLIRGKVRSTLWKMVVTAA